MRVALPVLILVALLLSGCQTLEQKVVGKWTGEIKPPEGQKMDPVAQQFLSGMGRMTLEIKQDKTFAAQVAIVPIEGSWSVEGSQLVLNPNKAFGFTAPSGNSENNQPIRMTLSGDGKLLQSVPGKPSDSTLVFRKDP